MTEGITLIPFYDSFKKEIISAEELDHLLARGWRHFGQKFFRYNINLLEDKPVLVLPLRVELADVRWSRSFRKIIRKTEKLRLTIAPTAITAEIEELFHLHKSRFSENIPHSLHTFLSGSPAELPCPNYSVCLWDEDELVAVSFLDIGTDAASSVYAMFHPRYGHLSPGIATIIAEIEYAKSMGKKYYYPGYAYHTESLYDYKKRLPALFFYDWAGTWHPMGEVQEWLWQLYFSGLADSREPE